MFNERVSKKTIIFSPICQDALILRYFLEGLVSLKSNGEIEIWFIDDNKEKMSKDLILCYVGKYKNMKVLEGPKLISIPYEKDENTHYWNSNLVDNIISIKNYVISKFLDTDFDQLFLIDSDIIVHPNLLKHLENLNRPIVSEVFWTRFQANGNFMPNVWDFQSYTHSSPDSIIRLKSPGVYKVGGLGACTLIKREPLEKGLSFSKISNLDYWGEDRHFCVRAACLGYDLFADTAYPPFHVYRQSLIPELEQWLVQGMTRAYFDRWLDADWEKSIRSSMINKNRKPKKLGAMFRQVMRIVKRGLDKK